MLRGLAVGVRQLASAAGRQAACRAAAHSAEFSSKAAARVTKAAQVSWGLASLRGTQLGGLRDCLRQQQGCSAVLGLRHFSLQQSLQGASLKVRAALEAPSKAAQRVRQTMVQASTAVYSKMPLQLEAFWQQHGKTVMVGGALMVAYVLWRLLYAAASVFVDLSDKLAMFGFLGLAISTLVGCFLFMRWRFSIDPNAVYRLAMLRLNTDPGLLEVMGAPLAGSPLRASIVTGGGLRFHGLRPKVSCRRLQMIFPLKGSERRGLVSLEAKKRRGHYSFKLLAVDVPSTVGGEQRIFLEGDENIYGRGGVMSELRDPFTRAMSMQEVYELEDEADELEDAEGARQEKEQRLALRRERGPKPLDDGGGMFFYESVWFALRRAVDRAKAALKPKEISA